MPTRYTWPLHPRPFPMRTAASYGGTARDPGGLPRTKALPAELESPTPPPPPPRGVVSTHSHIVGSVYQAAARRKLRAPKGAAPRTTREPPINLARIFARGILAGHHPRLMCLLFRIHSRGQTLLSADSKA